MKKTLLAAVAAVALVWSAGPAADAATPDDTLVMAAQIDDIISLDPAEIFEFSGAEYGAQVYDRLVTYDVNNVSDIQPMVAESWEVSDDGKTFTFRIREGITFHSGNPLTAHDAAYSLQRAVKLDLSPAFILTQFGFTKDNVDQMITAPDDRTLVLQIDQPYAPTFVLYCLTAGVASIVDSKLLQEHEVDGDMGHAWLKNNSAGSGPFMLQQWRPSEALSYTASPARPCPTPPSRTTGGARPGSTASSSVTFPKPPRSGCCWSRAMSTSPGISWPTSSTS